MRRKVEKNEKPCGRICIAAGELSTSPNVLQCSCIVDSPHLTMEKSHAGSTASLNPAHLIDETVASDITTLSAHFLLSLYVASCIQLFLTISRYIEYVWRMIFHLVSRGH